MRLCSFRVADQTFSGVLMDEWVVPIQEINRVLGTAFGTTLGSLIPRGQVEALRTQIHHVSAELCDRHPLHGITLCVPYTNPSKIWGIGLNYRDHAADLQAPFPTEPASFMKPATSIIGPGETIVLPSQSERVTGEAEIGVIIGKECKNVALAEVPQVIAGFTTIIDMTAEDILQRNPRFLTRAKSFDTFFSFGPWIVTPDEIADLPQVRTSTILNGVEHRSNTVANMAFPPYELVAFHSQVMTLKPGDIIACGTPGAVVLQSGDRVACEVSGLGRLENPVLRPSA